ncbi:glycosyltransferase [Paenibacillus beijingensis]|uniref:glycosyltransferase n=1 Tax=Paenibacillus beijingensis TaxID=1126833 RepID=UPI0009E28199|nr:glycosyltransferase [Paenibacillus beijingensis]
MKIAIVTETFLPSTDGIVTRLCATIRWLRLNGHHVCIIAPDLGVTEFEGAKVVGIPARSFFLYRDKKLAYPSRKLKLALKQFGPDLIHVVNPALLGVAGIFYGRRLKLPMIASYHTQIPHYADYYGLPFLKPVLWWFFRTLHNRADLNLCPSQAIQTELVAKRFRDVHVWKHGVNTELFGPDNYSESMRDYLTGGQTGKIMLLYVGRLAAEKNIEKLRDILDSSPDYCLALVGDGPHRSFLEKHFHGTNTVFAGFIHGSSLAQAYASSDIFVFPSTSETLGLVLLEAMVSGLPVVAAKSGPTNEQIEDGVTGFLFEAENTDSMKRAVEKLADPHVRAAMSSNSHATGSRFGWSMPSEQLLGFYSNVLKAKQRIPSGHKRQFATFSSIGLLNGLIDLLSLNLLLQLWKSPSAVGLIMINTIAYALAVLNSYYWNANFTFQQDASFTSIEKITFSFQALLSLLISNAVFLLSVYMFGLLTLPLWLIHNAAKGLSMAVSSVSSFFMMKYAVFRLKR